MSFCVKKILRAIAMKLAEKGNKKKRKVYGSVGSQACHSLHET